MNSKFRCNIFPFFTRDFISVVSNSKEFYKNAYAESEIIKAISEKAVFCHILGSITPLEAIFLQVNSQLLLQNIPVKRDSKNLNKGSLPQITQRFCWLDGRSINWENFKKKVKNKFNSI